jgi:mannose-6-phosphate isomerase-like protein (cupin superfamily)
MYDPRQFQMMPWFAPQMYFMYPTPFLFNPQIYDRYMQYYLQNQQGYNMNENYLDLKDYGPNPFVIDIDDAVKQNNTFRTVLWTGDNFQVTLMSIPVGEEIGLEVHETGDQCIRVEEGQGIVVMGDSEDKLDFRRRIYDDYAIVIPEGKWHNIINTGNSPLKIYVIYAPAEHPYGTVHQTKADAQASERYYR